MEEIVEESLCDLVMEIMERREVLEAALILKPIEYWEKIGLVLPPRYW